jgi:hypothetical protein
MRRETLTPEEAVADLEKIDGEDIQMAHIAADQILLCSVPPEVRAAYWALRQRTRDWWYA